MSYYLRITQGQTMNLESLNIEVKETHPISDVNFIKEQLIQYNNEKLGLPLNSPGPQPICIMIKNEAGEKIAGAYAHAYLNVFHIYGCWVHQDYRRQGIGKLIDKKLQEQAEKFHCHTATMETHSFQLTDRFYTKVGVLFKHKINNSPIGHTKYYLINKLDKDKNVLWKLRNSFQKLYSKIKENM